MAATNESNSGKRAPFPPLAIIGMGGLFPKSPNIEAFWSLIKSGTDTITEIPPTHWDPADYFSDDKKRPDFTYARRGGFLDPYPFDALKFGVPPNALEATDTSQLLGLVVAEQAMADAGYGPGGKPFDRDRASVVLGVTGALELVIPLGARLGHPMWREALLEAGLNEAQADDIVRRVSERYVPWQENSFPGLLGNVVAGRISKYLNTGGTNCVVDAACASSLSALELAALELATGKADLAITGGVDTFNDIFMYMCFSKTPALSPTGDARPFSANSDGTILGEGLGMIVLKRLADAERDGDRIHAVIRGVGSSSDGKGEAIYAPSAPGQVKALRDAYQSAGVTPDTIELIEAHGTGTPRGDAVETGALREVFGELDGRAPWCAVGSIKSQIGHTKAAAGGAGLIKAALALEHKVLPPTIKVDTPAESISPGATPLFVNTCKRPWLPRAGQPRRAGVSSFGFGGSNFHVVLEEYSAMKSIVDWDGNVQILAYSGSDASYIGSRLNEIAPDLTWDALRDAAHESRKTFHASARCRLVLVADRAKVNLGRMVSAIRAQLEKQPDRAWSLHDGAYYGVGAPEGSLAVLFPGQGAQYAGMLKDLACLFPEMLECLTAADAAYGESAGRERLSDFVYPHPAFDDATKKAQEEALRATAVAQPALGAVSLGAYRVLQRFGVSPACTAGHSYGELPALCAAGAFDQSTLIALSRKRGELMESGGGDRGGMIAVRGTLAKIEAVLAEERIALTPANKNTPEQVVFSGATEEIERAAKAFAARKISSTKLNVAAAFHSRFVSDAAGPFRAALTAAPFSAPRFPVFANTTAAAYPADVEVARDLLADQLANPVEFVKEIEAMYAAGVRTFVEAGPGARLAGMVGKILDNQHHRAIALDSSNGANDGVADLARVLALIAAEGRACELSKWDNAYIPAPKDEKAGRRMVVPICGANYRSEQRKPKPRPPAIATTAAKTDLTREQVNPRRHDACATDSGTGSLPRRALAGAESTGPNPPGIRSTDGAALGDLFRQTQESLEALQRMQEQTARVHAQYLQGQEEAARAFAKLIEQQERLFERMADGDAQVPHAVAPRMSAIREIPSAGLAETDDIPAGDSNADNELSAILLEVVSEKTGYPVEMLEPGMALDADLGIDSIKRVEILSALQERVPELPSLEAEELGAIATLGDIVAKLRENSETRTSRIPNARAVILGARGESVGRAPSSNVTRLLLDIVSEKTGYPVDMLDLGMALDADLGIDSIKRVEILSALQERLSDLPSLEAEELGAIRTLADIVARLSPDESSFDRSDARPAQSAGTSRQSDSDANSSDITKLLLDVVSEKTGYPVEILDMGMALDADLGIDSIKRVEILSALQERLPGLPSLEAEELGAIRSLADVIAKLGENVERRNSRDQGPEAAASQPRREQGGRAVARTGRDGGTTIGVQALRLQKLVAGRGPFGLVTGAVVGVISETPGLGAAVVTELKARGFDAAEHALDAPVAENVSGAILIGSGHAREAFLAVKAWGAALRRSASAGAKALACVTRLDGGFGLRDAAKIACADSGALAGLAKTAAREWPDVVVRALDVAPDFANDADAARALVDEFLSEGPVEAAISPDGAATIVLEPATTGGIRVGFNGRDVVVVTGGARGVTAACALALARHGAPKLALIGRSPMPDAEAEWLCGVNDERAIKKALLDRAREPLSPHELERAYRDIVVAREIRATLQAITAAGALVRYYTADVRNGGEVRNVIARIPRDLGPITGLVHGAGVIVDRRIEDKTAEQFDAVYDTKVGGLRNVLAAVPDMPLKFLALFSSSTGRFGRVGQADYAMANEALNKIARVESARRPGCRVVSFNWGPWDGGMVTPALRRMFEKEGIGVIPLEMGADILARELAPGGRTIELVVLAHPEATINPRPSAHQKAELTTALTIDLSVEQFPFLASHVIDGHPVLPVAMYIEWMAHAALHANPGLRFVGIEDLRVLKGVILENGGALRLELAIAKPKAHEDHVAVGVELRSKGGATVHSSATVLIGTTFGLGKAALANRVLPDYRGSRDDVYRGLLFHGPLMQGIVSVNGCGDMGISVTSEAAPVPDLWIADPLRRRWIADPLAIDCAFQAMILWSFNRFTMGGLPVRIGRYQQFQTAFPKGGVHIEARVEKSTGHSATAAIEFIDPSNGALIARMDGYECVMDTSLNEAFRRNRPLQPLKD